MRRRTRRRGGEATEKEGARTQWSGLPEEARSPRPEGRALESNYLTRDERDRPPCDPVGGRVHRTEVQAVAKGPQPSQRARLLNLGPSSAIPTASLVPLLLSGRVHPHRRGSLPESHLAGHPRGRTAVRQESLHGFPLRSHRKTAQRSRTHGPASAGPSLDRGHAGRDERGVSAHRASCSARSVVPGHSVHFWVKRLRLASPRPERPGRGLPKHPPTQRAAEERNVPNRPTVLPSEAKPQAVPRRSSDDRPDVGRAVRRSVARLPSLVVDGVGPVALRPGFTPGLPLSRRRQSEER